MGIESILRALASETEAERDAILAAAQAEAARVVEKAREEAAARRERRLEVELRAVRAEQARIVNAARLEGLRRLAAAREHLGDAVFDEAAAQLARLRDSGHHRRVFSFLLAEAAAEIGSTPIVLRVDPADADLAAELAERAGLDARVEPTLRCAGGLEAQDPDGRVVVHNTLESRLDRAREQLRAEVLAEIEGRVEECRPAPVGG